ncbi:hypothetical protein BT96DRAFT_1041444 [Gymnopus androsaceus JB14]|uniref:Tyr recombinase domain-containing protein n=1 Tax=Gymnopus androsaceus JB14 TaxID=1447944 RepID=A0A6A4GC15_9AGAR|nr:hypothetical protein BT96DRAFT_1041444 [Gymnopus androsaceus JB14]
MQFEDIDSLLPETIDNMISECMQDFSEHNEMDDTAKYAAKIAAASISSSTRTGHIRIIKAYIIYHLKRNPKWDPMGVTGQTPYDIISFITQKCGRSEDGFEGRKYATAVSSRAALTLWYRHVRPNESMLEWWQDTASGSWLGLPTRSRKVVEFMTGLEKQKAKDGDVSQSARALTVDDMHRLYDHLIAHPNLDAAARRSGIIRYAAYLFAWLLMLRIDEALSLRFESIDKIPGERRFVDVRLLGTRKTAQAGVSHFWRMHANDLDPRLCPIRILALLAAIYKGIRKSGPLFLRTSAYGAVLSEKPIVRS